MEQRDVVATAAVALLLVIVPVAWDRSRHVVTLVHEGGHAIAAVLTGRRLNSIHLRSDTSGLTVSSGKPRGPGMVATAAAGYLAPAVLGLAVSACVGSGRTDVALWVALVALGLMLLYIRNWFGLLVVVLCGAAVALAVWRAPERVQDLAALTVGWFLLLGAPRAVLELWGHRRRARTRTSDADVLARLTHVPAAIWNVVLLLLTVAALGVGVWMVG